MIATINSYINYCKNIRQYFLDGKERADRLLHLLSIVVPVSFGFRSCRPAQ